MAEQVTLTPGPRAAVRAAAGGRPIPVTGVTTCRVSGDGMSSPGGHASSALKADLSIMPPEVARRCTTHSAAEARDEALCCRCIDLRLAGCLIVFSGVVNGP